MSDSESSSLAEQLRSYEQIVLDMKSEVRLDNPSVLGDVSGTTWWEAYRGPSSRIGLLA